MRRFVHYLWLTFKTAFIVSIVLAAVALALARVAINNIDRHHAYIEELTGEFIGRPAKMGTVDAEWRGINPVLRLNDLRLLDDDGQRTVARLGDARAGIDMLTLLREQRIKLSRLRLSGAELSLVRLADGRITLEGSEDRQGESLLPQLFAQPFDIEQSRIDVRLTDGRRLRFNELNLSLRSQGSRYTVEGTTSLPEGRGENIAFALGFSGDLTEPGQWDGNFYFEGRTVDLGYLLGERDLAGVDLHAGLASFALWGAWQDTALQSLEGNMLAEELQLSSAASQTPVPINLVHGQLDWQRKAEGWQLAVENFALGRDNESVVSTRVEIAAASTSGQPQAITADFGFLRLEDISALLLASNTLEDSTHKTLRALRPRGELHNLQLHLPIEGADQNAAGRPFDIRARFTDLAVDAWKGLPALQGLSGVVHGNQDTGTLQLASRSARLSATPMFRAPFDMASLAGQVEWRRSETGLTLKADNLQASNQDVRARLDGVIELPKDSGSPLLGLRVKLEDGDVASVPHYLPISLIPNKVVRWLDKALVKGRISSGAAQIQGRISDFPFTDGRGKLEVRLEVSDGTLNYADDWPRIEDIEAEVLFSGPDLRVAASSGKIFDAEILQAHAVIENMAADGMQLAIKGQSRGPTAAGLRFIGQSPLKEKIGVFVEDISVGGNGLLDLDLLIPFSEGTTEIEGTLALSNNTLSLANEDEDLNVKLADVSGTLDFTQMGLTGNAIEAHLGGQSMQLDVRAGLPQQAGGQEAAEGALLVDASGEISAADLAAHLRDALPRLQAEWPDVFEGVMPWTATLRVDEREGGGLGGDLTLASSLQGMVLQLPEPLTKSADQAIAAVIKLSLSGESPRQIRVRFGERLDGIFELVENEESWKFRRGNLHLGADQAASLSAEEGLHIGGELPRFSLTSWRALLEPAGEATDSPSLIDQLASVNVRIGSLELFGQEIDNTHIEAVKGAQQWQAKVNSEQIIGGLRLSQGRDSAWIMDFERLHLLAPDADGAQAESIDPRDLPALRMSSDSFKYGELDLGRLSFQASERPSGLHVADLKFALAETEVSGQGDWLTQEDGQVSQFDLNIVSGGLGNTLDALGYAANIANGAAQLSLSAQWPGSPMDLALEKLNGTLAVDIGQGRLLDVEPGAAGRVFGLLSLDALPRRLTLDFSDLFGEGFRFDSITGQFNLNSGMAVTDNLVLEGPSATVTVVGKTDLAEQHFDQEVTVSPQIGASLPLLGALAGGVGVGAAIFLAQKIFKPEIDNIVAYKYTVNGPWQDPVIERVNVDDADDSVN